MSERYYSRRGSRRGSGIKIGVPDETMIYTPETHRRRFFSSPRFKTKSRNSKKEICFCLCWFKTGVLFRRRSDIKICPFKRKQKERRRTCGQNPCGSVVCRHCRRTGLFIQHDNRTRNRKSERSRHK